MGGGMPSTSKTADLVKSAERDLAPAFEQAEEIAAANQMKVLAAFRNNRLTEEFFAERTGYGMDDQARVVIDQIFAEVFGCEKAAVRMQFVSGTHALAAALFGNLMPGDRLAAITGAPYDTLEPVIGYKTEASGSLKSLKIDYLEADACAPQLTAQEIDEILKHAVAPPTTVAYIQKSRGYSFARRSLSNTDIRRLAEAVKRINPKCLVLVDNCYGELVEEREPTAAGADLMAGSLIKNPGGGLAISGGYLAGSEMAVDRALNRLTAPGIGGHLGISFNQNRLLLQGLFLAPSVVLNAVKGALLAARVFAELGFEVSPQPDEPRVDIIQAIKFDDRERLVNFLKAIQRFSPVNAHVTPEPASMPGYSDEVVMAGGTFVEGSTIEFSADGPLRPPFVAFVQGGLSYLHVRCAIQGALELGQSGECPFLKS
jgi:cystathionine beta-lyase family protein involved in aluminum resistance